VRSHRPISYRILDWEEEVVQTELERANPQLSRRYNPEPTQDCR